MIEVVSATRLSATQFRKRAALGISLQRLAHDTRLQPAVVFENRTGLPEIYNRSIRGNPDHEIVLLIHDDVWIEDVFIADRVLEGLAHYDVIGVAGNRRRLPGQTSWHFVDKELTRDTPENLSGCVGHGPSPFGTPSLYGPAPAPCELLDGVLLAARKRTLLERDVLFDTRFAFDFYDLDFCRTARNAGLRLGTWPISITHQSLGNFGTSWKAGLASYMEKWRE